MAEKLIHVKMYDQIYRIVPPGYAVLSSLADGTLNGLGKPVMDVVVGEKYAAVIDTGYGEVDLKGYIEKNITDKPLICLNTHGHLDHAGGNNQFDKVYVHWRDIELAKSCAGPLKSRQCAEVLACPATEYVPLYGGEIIDLGGRTLRVINTPSHTYGSVSFLDSKTKVLFAGDAVLKRIITHVTATAKFQRTMLDNLRKEDFTDILGGHWLWPMDRAQIDRLIGLIDHADTVQEAVLTNHMGGQVTNSFMLYVGKDFYDPDFAAMAFAKKEQFFDGEFELGDKITPPMK